jgi:exonuclease SbcC
VKLHRLELEGFGPFRERQSVDFDAFADDGLFLLTGRTGAGKSSVLDGVSFALYGSVPRYADGDKRLRSDHCDPDDPSEVVLDFEVSGGRWRVARSPEYQRPKRRGDGFTTEGQRARLDEWIPSGAGGEWMTRASGPRDVGLALDEVLGLTRDQFLQVILLAQGRFQQFLLAKNDERQALLRTLFGTRRYEEYQQALDERRRAADRALGDGAVRLDMLLDQADGLVSAHGLGDRVAPATSARGVPDPDAAPVDAAPADAVADDAAPVGAADRLAAGVRAVARADYRAEAAVHAREAADAAFDAVTAAHAALQARVQARIARESSRAALARLEAVAPAIDADRVELERASRAEELRDILAATARAESAAERSRAAVAAALESWTAQGEGARSDPPAEPGALRAHADDLTGAIAVWAAAQAVERRLDELRAGDRAATDAIAVAEAAVAAIDASRAQTPAREQALTAQIDSLTDEAASAAAAEAALTDVDVRLAAAREAESLASALHVAEVGYAARIESTQAAASALTLLMRRRLAGYAGELADALVDGEPCAVCGSLDHPHPAGPPAAAGRATVTDDAIAAAESAKDAASAAERLAADSTRTARTAHAEAAARAGGEDVATIEARRAEAAASLDAARAAAARRAALVEERTRLVARDAAAADEREAAARRLGDLREQAAAAHTRLEQAERTVAEARGDAASVADRIVAATAVRDAARSLAAAIDARTSADADLADAVRERDVRVAASGFAGTREPGAGSGGTSAEGRASGTDPIAAVRAALRDDAARASLAERIRSHEIALAAEKQRLLQLELDLADDDGSELDETASARAVADAGAARALAAAAAAEARQTAIALRDLVQRADAAHAATAELAARHAVVQRLANTVAGRAPNTHLMTLETFVLAAELEEIVERANLRLSEMSAGRYRLQHTDALARRRTSSGLGLEVMDSFTGQARPPQSLSGGETFLASLALALGLAEAVTANAGGIRLDTLFIDEGFGSLDAETLELAMRTLDELRQGGRTVGIISHVEAMKDQVPAQLRVEATPQGPSRILQEAAVPG